LQWQSEWSISWSGWWNNGVQSFQQGLASGISFLALSGPALEPGHVGGDLQHVVTVPSGDWDERNGDWVPTDLFDVRADLRLDFFVTLLAVWWLGGVHLVDSDNHLLDTQGVGQQCVFSGLTVLGDTSLEFTNTGSDYQDSAIGLGGTSDHVLNEISVARGVDDGDVELGGLEFPEGNVDGDTTLSLGLKLIQYPSVFERAFAHISGLFLELLDGSLVDTTAFVDQVTGGCGLTGVDVTDDDNVNVGLIFWHLGIL